MENRRIRYKHEHYAITSGWCNAELIEHIKDYIWEAEEIKITRIKDGWSLKIKTIKKEE